MENKKGFIVFFITVIISIAIMVMVIKDKYITKKMKYLNEIENIIGNINVVDYTSYEDLKYGNGINNSYDLYVPNDINKNSSQGVMLFIHGGSWESGDKADMAYFCKIMTKAGYITANMNHSFVNSEGSTTFYDILDEITSCLSSIKEKGKELDINIDKATLHGYSSGGHLALLYSYSRKDEAPIELKFLFEQAGPTDFHRDSWSQYDDEFVINSIFKYTGSKITEQKLLNGDAENIINSISPISYIDGNSIPSLVAFASKDTTVYPIHYEKIKKAFDKNNVIYDIMEFKNSNHVLYTDIDRQKEFFAEALRYANKYFGY